MEKVKTLGSRGGPARLARIAAAAALCAVLASCGGGSGGTDTTASDAPPPPPSKAESARFLTQTTFGPSEAEINALSASS